MKEKKIYLIFGFISLISIASMVSGLAPLTNYTTNTSDQCTNPTLETYIGVIIGSYSYNVTNINVPKNTCVKFVFVNSDPSESHTFTINENSTINVALLNIYIQGEGTGNSTFMTPNLDITLLYYCAVPGHYNSGMFGYLKVGLGSISVSQTNSIPSKSSLNNTVTTTNYSSMALYLGIAFIILLRKRGKK